MEELYPIEFRLLANQNAYLRLERMDAEEISRLITLHREEIENASRLIIDLRRCVGGDEGAGWKLFPYLVDRKRALSELIGDEGSFMLCTKENCAIRISQLEAARETLMAELAAEQLQLLDREIAFYRSNAGKGLVFSEPDRIEDEVIRPAAKAPEQVILLTDTFCENEGEQFAAMCQRCGAKVRTIGRPTMGTLDYFDNIDLQVHKHITLSYPIRMSRTAYEGRGISEKGLPVDTYIPWTPEEIRRDVLLETAIC